MVAPVGELLAGVNLSGVGDAWDDWLGQQRRRFETGSRPSPSALLPTDPQARRQEMM